MSDDEMITNITYRIAEILIQKNDESEDGINYDPVIPIAPVISAHLKFFLSSIIHLMTHYKRKYLFFCPLLNGKRNPKRPHSSMSTEVVYENTPFNVKNFFQLLKDNPQVIPHRAIYQVYMERLLSHESLKPDLEKRDVEERSKE